MSRKRNRQIQVQPSQAKPQNLPDARHEVAARASKALRSAEITRFRQNLIQVFNQVQHEQVHQVQHEQVRTNPSRPLARKSVQETTYQRRVPTQSELRNTRMPSKVRNQLQDGIRTLACEQRRTRKEVIFALRRAGKAGSRNKKAKWTQKSYLRCK